MIAAKKKSRLTVSLLDRHVLTLLARHLPTAKRVLPDGVGC